MVPVEDFAARLLDETRAEITRADTKASILLAGAGVALAGSAGAFANSNLTLTGERGAVQVLAVAAVVLVMLGIFALGTAVFPTIGKATPGEANYFMDHKQYKTDAELRAVVERYALDPATRHIHQVHQLSPIVYAKYWWTRLGEVLIGLGLAAGVASLIAHVTM